LFCDPKITGILREPGSLEAGHGREVEAVEPGPIFSDELWASLGRLRAEVRDPEVHRRIRGRIAGEASMMRFTAPQVVEGQPSMITDMESW
jgi:hypothetical protein